MSKANLIVALLCAVVLSKCASVAAPKGATGEDEPRAAGRATNPPQRSILHGGPLEMNLSMARLPDVMRELASGRQLAIVADAYSDDPTLPRIQVDGVPERLALPQIARLYEREMLEIDGVLVLRHRAWVVKDWAESRLFPWRYSATGRVHELGRLPDPGTPRVRCAIEEVGLPELSRLLRRETGITLTFPSVLSAMRVSVAANRISVTQLAAALGDLIVATPSVSISRTPEQAGKLEALHRDASDPRSERQRASDELKQEIAAVLTPEEFAKLAAFQEVNVDIGRLSPAGRRKALAYLDTCWARIQAVSPDLQGQGLDPRRGVSLNVQPISSLAVGVNTFKLDGTPVAF
jgi:hypothetical protein